MLGKALTTAAAGSAAGAAGGLGIEDVFSTYLYTGNGTNITSTQTITNEIDLAGEGGMVFVRHRNFATIQGHIYDTERGPGNFLAPDSTSGQGVTGGYSVSAFNSDGFTLLANYNSTNKIGYDYASWTFRKAPGFFDVVTYAGDGAPNRQISHNLGSTPGMIIVKKLDSNIANFGWYVWHRSLSSNQEMLLNSTAAASSNSIFTAVTSTYFTPASTLALNGSGSNYVAYFFAHDDQSFGESADQSVIKCGSFSGSIGNGGFVDLGWEPQWVLAKRADSSENWQIGDTMRGATTNDGKVLYPNTSGAEASFNRFTPQPTGFNQFFGGASAATYIYIAIRRGPMKTPTDATEVFYPDAVNTTVNQKRTTGFPVDLQLWRSSRNLEDGNFFITRLTGVSTIGTSYSDEVTPYLRTYASSAETSTALTRGWDNAGYKIASTAANLNNWYLNFGRAPGFLDVATYIGTGTTPNNITHNLGVVPELIITKGRSVASNWLTYHSALGATKYLILQGNQAANTNSTVWDDTEPTASQFTVGASQNTASATYIAYLFASCPGVSKVGSYTGTATTLSIDCGFSAGARFVLIKRTDSTGDWYVWDTARGITSGADPYLLLNSTAAEVTYSDYIDPLSSGFQITSSAPAAINASGGSFIFLAIA